MQLISTLALATSAAALVAPAAPKGDILSDEASMLVWFIRYVAVRVPTLGGPRRLRAHPRLGARHRGHGRGEPARHDPLRGYDVPVRFAPARPREAAGRCRRGGPGRGLPHERHRER